MQGLVSRRLNSLFATGRGRAKQRRPEGVSRRRLRQLHVEPLEDRRVMTASGPLTAMQYETALATQIVTHSYLNLLQSVGVYGNAGAGQILDASNYRAPLLGALGGNLNTVSYSTDTADGQLARYLGDMYWQSLTSGAGAELELRSIPLDPLLSYQWHLINSGQNTGGPDWQPIYRMPGEAINVAPVWNLGYTGAGAVVAVIDSGVQLNHPDLAANIDLNRQLNAVTGAPDGSPGNLLLASAHGTAVAGLIGAVANNGIGGAGVAPGVTLVPINLAGGLGTPVVNAIRYAIMNDVDITNNSYGPSDAIRTLAGPSPQELLALRDSVVFGRDGLGVIHVWASGNGAGPGFSGVGTFDSSNYDGYANSRYTIAVTGVDHDGSYNNFDGTVTNYMEAGANVLVAAPTGSIFLDIANDILVGSGIWTTDTYQLVNGRDLAGFNTDPDPVTGAQTDLARDFFPDTTYTSRFNGTSAATPIVSGVVALMLEANPNLSWRDVQEILVRSARQNDPLGVPTAGSGAQTKNPWIVNQTPIFHDPDIYNPSIPIPSLTRIFNPTLDPNAALFFSVGANGAIYSDHYVGSPSVMTNGAGYTVAQGRGVYGEQMGYGHGVVDAEMAVALAQQWHLKGQALPSELTYTSFVYPLGNVPLNIPAAERAIEDAGYLIVPGGIGGESGFIDFWNEYFADEPDFTQDFDFRGQSSLEFSVPSSNTMKIESVDVKLTITGDASAAMDYMRILLVSPSGTYSELNHYWYGDYTRPFSLQDPGDSGIFIGVGLSSQAPEGALTWTFNTNRSWGERSNDALIFDPITNEPVTDRIGIFGNPNNPTSAGTGDALKQGWRLVIENWDDSNSFGLQGVELAWHGSPIAANSQRVQGFVGVDDNGDDLFNFSRVIQSITTPAGEVPRLGDVTATPDANQESFAGNVTVTVRRTADGSLVSQFVTGHDGNYYFDLVPDNYTISIEDPLGRFPKDDATTPGGFLRHFQSEWRITSDWFRAWDYDETLRNEVKVGPTGAPLGWVDGNGEFAASGIRNINFLLDPGPVAADQVVFTGTVFADVNGDGVFNTDDINLPNVLVFGDVNRNGVRDPGEATALTDANGNFTLTVPTTAATVMNVGVVRPTNWTSTSDGPSTSDSPTDGLETFFVRPGAAIGGLSFAMQPPANNIGGGGANQPGILMGVVYDDANNSQSRQAGEAGASNITVYLDLNNSGVLDFGDISTVTNANGAFVFTNVPAGTYVIRTVVNSPLVQTTPTPGTGRVVSLTGSSTISNIQFGIRNTAEYDFGDLPAKYGATLLAENGARHKKSAYWLGEKIDYELDG
ncbi:MAG TPA: S8 family serine peptidase, partial [Lacipirellulaceae bacterium]|nr:S8 family serine peptidase [Lacipirellulaceae bacterium]